MPRTVTLIKHARPEKVAGIDSHGWPLSAEGRNDARRLGERLAAAAVPYSAVLTSREPKAAETAEIVAGVLGIPCHSHDGLEEHDRSNVPLMKTAEFVSAIELFFRKPQQLVLGNETARQALRRFETAIDRALEAHPDGNVIVVSHGTVLALWLSHYCHLQGYEVWRQMGLPSFVSVTWPDCEIVARQDQV